MSNDDRRSIATNLDVCGIRGEISLTRAEMKRTTLYLRQAENRLRKKVKTYVFGRMYKHDKEIHHPID